MMARKKRSKIIATVSLSTPLLFLIHLAAIQLLANRLVMTSKGNDDLDEEEFSPLEEMPSLRLQDIAQSLDKPSTSIVNLDALIPRGEDGELVLQTIFFKIQRAVKVLSLRFNHFSPFSLDLIVDWIAQNDHLEVFYLMGSGIDDKNRKRVEDAWKKNLTGHRFENMGFTFIRVTFETALAQKAEEASKN